MTKKLIKAVLIALTVLLIFGLYSCDKQNAFGDISGTSQDSYVEDTSQNDNVVPSTSSSQTQDTENTDTLPNEPDSDTPLYFVADVKINSLVAAIPYTEEYVPSQLKGVYYSAVSPGGEPVNDGTGNIWLRLIPSKDYYVSGLDISGSYDRVEQTDTDIYCIFGVKSDLSVTLKAKTLPIIGKTLLADYGYGISDDGLFTVTWERDENTPVRYIELSYSDSHGSYTNYFDPANGSVQLFKMIEKQIYKVKMRAIGYKSAGNTIELTGCYMNEPKEIPFPRVEIVTENYVWPSCDFVQSPAGCWGAGITNALYEQCVMTLYNKDNEVVYSSAARGNEYLGAKMKIRGNTSARYASNGRYPYKLKLDAKFDLLEPLIGRADDGRAYADKDWLLLNYGNDGYRICGDAIADAVGTEWSPDYCYVTLYVNGEYRGLYVLSEAVEEGSGTGEEQWRVPADNDGFVFECDAYWWNEDLYFSTPMTEKTPMYFTFKYPDSDKIDENSPEYIYLKNYMIEFENALRKNDDSYLDYIDLDSFVRWLLVADYLSIEDGGGCNLFLYKKDSTDNTKLKMGPNWDFDSYMGDVQGLAIIRLSWDTAPFYYQHLIKKSSFQKRYNELFLETKDILVSYIEESFSRVDMEAHGALLQFDRVRFGTSAKTLEVRRDTFIQWLNNHVEWMETQFG